MAITNRDETIKRIRTALKARTGRTWSVRGGRGTAWGWITVSAPPARLVCRYACGPTCSHDRYTLSADDEALLALALGFVEGRSTYQGVSIAASSDYYREYIDRAEGRAPSVIGTPYWD
jgi:hypothetical protein